MTTTDVDGGATTTTEPPETKQKDYRVFKRDSMEGARDRWSDLGVTTFEGKYAAYPTAETLGHLWGEGVYLHFPAEGYGSAEFVTVVADTVYRQAEETE